MKTKVMNELKELYQNCPDTMNLIKVIVASSLFSAFLVCCDCSNNCSYYLEFPAGTPHV